MGAVVMGFVVGCGCGGDGFVGLVLVVDVVKDGTRNLSERGLEY